MTIILDLQNSENWQTRDSQFFTVSPGNKLPEYTSLVTFTSNIICTLIDNATARETWNFAGWIAQKVNVPVGPASSPSTVNDRRLWLRRKQVLIFPAEIPTYQVTVRFPKWFHQASVTVWEYQVTQQQSP